MVTHRHTDPAYWRERREEGEPETYIRRDRRSSYDYLHGDELLPRSEVEATLERLRVRSSMACMARLSAEAERGRRP